MFIHGYNVSFKDTLFTVAQIRFATNYRGRVYMYSWPSAASTLRYIADMDNAEEAEPFLQSFLKLLMRDADIDDIDILVHSMGSQSALRALSALRSVFETERQGAVRPTKIRIGQIMFAAPDVARPVFDQKIRRIAPYADRVTVYASLTDAALLASKFLRSGASRMGELNDDGEPLFVEVKNVHVIDATGPERWWRLDRISRGTATTTSCRAKVSGMTSSGSWRRSEKTTPRPRANGRHSGSTRCRSRKIKSGIFGVSTTDVHRRSRRLRSPRDFRKDLKRSDTRLCR